VGEALAATQTPKSATIVGFFTPSTADRRRLYDPSD
jgi:hypothetical protein